MRTANTNKRHRIIRLFSALLGIVLWPSLVAAGTPLPLISLDDAFARAIIADERIKIAERDLFKSRILSDKASTYFWPSMDVQGGYFEADEEVASGPYLATSTSGLGTFEVTQADEDAITPESEWRGKFQFSQPLYRGVYFPSKQQAEKVIERSAAAYQETIQDTLLDVERVYFEILRIKELVLNAEEILKLAREELDIATVKYEAGQATEDIVLKAELYVTEAERKKIEYQNDLRSAKDALSNLIGFEANMTHFDVVAPLMRTVPNLNYDFLIKVALKNRYDHRVAALNVNVAESDVDIVKARFHPTLQATWDYHLSDTETISHDKEYWIGAITMNMPILEGKLRICDLREKKESLMQARLNLDASKKKIRMQVQDAILQVDSFQGVLRNLEKQVELAQKNYEIISTQFEYGSATSL